jgi:hypothetical protein
MGRIIAAGALTACLAGAPRGAAGDEVKDLKTVARATVASSAKAVVTVKLVVKIKVTGGARGGRETETKLEVVGTVIDPSGLTVVPASAVEPTSMLGGMGRRGGRGGGMGGDMQIDSEVTETTIVLDDGSEVDAAVVLKDADLDLAFIKPREPQKLAAIELKPRGRAPELLEDIFTVGRLGRAESRATAVSVGTVKAIVKGPRTFYICTPEVAANQGCVAYAADGSTLGIFVVKVAPGEGGGGFGRLGGGGRGEVTAILRPVEDVLELAKQAKEAKLPERKPKASEADAKKDGGAAGETGDEPAAPARPEPR